MPTLASPLRRAVIPPVSSARAVLLARISQVHDKESREGGAQDNDGQDVSARSSLFERAGEEGLCQCLEHCKDNERSNARDCASHTQKLTEPLMSAMGGKLPYLTQ